MTSIGYGFGSIRSRITAIAAIAVALVLVVLAIVLVAIVQRELLANLDSSLEQRADSYETSFAAQDADSLTGLLGSSDEDRAAQLTGADGTLIASTPDLVTNTFGDETVGALPFQTIRSISVVELEGDNYRVLARVVELDSGPAVLHVAQDIDDLNDTVRGLKVALGLTVPVVVALLAALVWWLVGRTLRPVDAMRAEAADISGTDLSRRLPVPDQADEIARLASTMNQMLDRIDSAGRRQREFVADASHELRTPLTRIRTEVEVDLNRPALADPVATNVRILEEAVALQNLLDDLLFLARSDEHQHRTSREPTDLDDIVLREVHALRGDTAIRIDTTQVSAAHLDGDANQLRRVVRNLLGNAIHHAKHTVTVTVGEVGDMVRLTVADDGDGVPHDARDRIFERFGRSDDARSRASGGAGLGLAIVRDIVDRHHGEIRYDGSRAPGARFIVEMPTTNHEARSGQSQRR